MLPEESPHVSSLLSKLLRHADKAATDLGRLVLRQKSDKAGERTIRKRLRCVLTLRGLERPTSISMVCTSFDASPSVIKKLRACRVWTNVRRCLCTILRTNAYGNIVVLITLTARKTKSWDISCSKNDNRSTAHFREGPEHRGTSRCQMLRVVSAMDLPHNTFNCEQALFACHGSRGTYDLSGDSFSENRRLSAIEEWQNTHEGIAIIQTGACGWDFAGSTRHTSKNRSIRKQHSMRRST